MSIKDLITKFFSGFQDYYNTEKELLKLKIIKEISGVMGIVVGAVFIIMLFHITIALIGLWLGFWISSMLGSYALGFGITGLIYLIWLIISVIFRKKLLIKPFTDFVVTAMTEKYNKQNEDEQQGT